MNLKCPNCNTVIPIDQADYAAILAQVRNAEFDAEVEKRLKEALLAEAAKEKARAVEAQAAAERRLADKDRDAAALQSEIERLKGLIANAEAQKKSELAVAEAERIKAVAEVEAKKNSEISQLQNALDRKDSEREMALVNERNAQLAAISARDKEITVLSAEMKVQQTEMTNRLNELTKMHDRELKNRDEEIERLRDMKMRLSTKMIGETLEQHCAIEFARQRSFGSFPNAVFGKDNDISIGGTKGDFIFRDYIDGQEYISIMFEMKNEAEDTATKHRNSDFYAKLDKDRRDKNCQFAVLVSLLERDNEAFNEGIFCVREYERMFVIRPQMFMNIIFMLSEMANKSFAQVRYLNAQLEEAKTQNIDVTNFEAKRNEFCAQLNKGVEDARKKHDEAIAGIDKAILALQKQIEQLEKIKNSFANSNKLLLKADENFQENFTIKKLTRGNKTMQRLFAEAADRNALEASDYSEE